MPPLEGMGAVDLMIGFPSAEPARKYDAVRRLTRDAGSAAMTFPAEHLFRRPPNELPEGADPVEVTLAEMDRAGVAVGMVSNPDGEVAGRALRDHPDRFVASLAVKWPGLHYMTSGFAPRYYSQAIVDYANTRGADKVMYAGYYPMGLSLRRIFDELPGVPLKDEVLPRFLRDNAVRVFKLGEEA
jgi:hypothetical protein